MRALEEKHFAVLRRHMAEMIAIHVDLASDELGKAALDERVMAAMGKVPRHRFVLEPLAPHAYQDMPLPIGFDKTVSQPFIVALMADLLSPQPHEIVLEIGTGLGYQAALLAELARQVWSVEIVERKACRAAQGADDGPLLLAGLPGQLGGRAERSWPSSGPRWRPLRMVSVETP